ncbi:MAG: hypothetical protein ABIV11_08270 [Gemmatimonadaceae bacterium]
MASEVRRVIAIFVILVTGFWGMVVSFSDSPSSWPTTTLIAYIAAWHIPGAFAVGYLYPRKWRLGLLVCWGAVLMSGEPLVSVAVLLAAGVAAYLGRLLAVRRLGRQASGGADSAS